ncbi:MAG: T9SS type A sorting domain-containing protein [Bacteroidales bacterium]|nr:T9SS type A sorting domain-containing protein [Bacteroidales bacterium]
MRKQYILLLLLLFGATLGASAQGTSVSLTAPDTVCYGVTVDFDTANTVLPSGSFSWTLQTATDPSATFERLDTINGLPLQITDTASRYYRIALYDSSAMQYVYSDTVYVHVLPPFDAGHIIGPATVCYGAVPDSIRMDIYPNHQDSLSYQWQEQLGTSPWVDVIAVPSLRVSHVTDTTCQPTVLENPENRYRLIVTDNVCNVSDTTNVHLIEVLPEFTMGTVSASQSICPGATPDSLIASGFSGGDNSFTYQWQYSTENGNWTDIDGAESITLTTGPLTVDHWYRIKAANATCATTLTSAAVQVHVFSRMIPPAIITLDTTICKNTTVTLSATPATSEQGNPVTHHWQYRALGYTEWTTVDGVFANSYTTDFLTITTEFRVMAFTSCDTIYSDSVRINVLPVFNPGTIRALVDTVCFGQIWDTIRFSEEPSGCLGNIAYTWQHRAIGGSWINDGLGGMEYITGSEMDDETVAGSGYEYRAEVMNECGQGFTNVDTIHLRARLSVVGTIGMPNALCYGDTLGTLTVNAQYGSGQYSYQWQDSTVGGTTTWSNFGTDSNTVVYGLPVYDSMWFRVQVTDRVCPETVTSSRLLKVYDTLVGPHIALPAVDTLCYNTALDTALYLDTLPTGDNGLYKYFWEWKTAADTVWTSSPVSPTSYNAGNLETTTTFRVKAIPTSGICGYRYSTNEITINVLEPLQPGTLAATDTLLCHHTSDILFFDTLPSGADGLYSFLWQSSADSVDFDTLVVTTLADSLATPPLDSSIYYRVIVKNDRCGEVVTNTVAVRVLEPLVVSTISVSYPGPSDSTTIPVTCYGTAPDFTFHGNTTQIHGASGDYTYCWQSSDDDVVYDTVANGTTPTAGYAYAPDTLYKNTWFRLAVTDSLCGTDYTNSIMVLVHDLPKKPTLGGDTAYLCSSDNYVRYWVAPEENIEYNWIPGTGGTVQGNGDSSAVYIQWSSSVDSVILSLWLRDTVTSCSRTVTFDAIPIDTTHTAPDTTTIRIKKGANILICRDDNANAHYEWGYTDRSTGEDYFIPNSDCRYYRLSDTVDLDRYDYFVIVRYGDIPCKTRSYYIPGAPESNSASSDELHLVVSPNPSFGEVFYTLDADIPGAYTLSVYDAVGQLLFTQDCNDYVRDLPVRVGQNLRQGIYVVAVTTNNRVVSQKIIVK